MLSWSEEDKKKLFTALCPSRDGGESATAYFRFLFLRCAPRRRRWVCHRVFQMGPFFNSFFLPSAVRIPDLMDFLRSAGQAPAASPVLRYFLFFFSFLTFIFLMNFLRPYARHLAPALFTGIFSFIFLFSFFFYGLFALFSMDFSLFFLWTFRALSLSVFVWHAPRGLTTSP